MVLNEEEEEEEGVDMIDVVVGVRELLLSIRSFICQTTT